MDITLGTLVKTVTTPTKLEKTVGSLPVEATMTVIAAIAGGALAPLLPVLTNALASNRQRARVESTLADISVLLLAMGDRINELSDSQYKIVNETILTILHTVDSEKLKILKRAVAGSVNNVDIASFDAYHLTRLLRDISAQEVAFLRKNFSFERIRLVTSETKTTGRQLEIQIDTMDGRLAAGLVSLGILAAVGGTIADMGTYRFTPIAGKLLALLGDVP